AIALADERPLVLAKRLCDPPFLSGRRLREPPGRLEERYAKLARDRSEERTVARDRLEQRNRTLDLVVREPVRDGRLHDPPSLAQDDQKICHHFFFFGGSGGGSSGVGGSTVGGCAAVGAFG